MRLKVAVIKGDGVGPEMMEPALKTLETVSRIFGHTLEWVAVAASGESIESCYNPLPDESLEKCRRADAVLLGNTGLTKYRNLPLEKRPEFALMKLRKELGVTTNIRPVHSYSSLAEFSPLKERIIRQGLDFLFVRDIVGGILCSDKVKCRGEKGMEAYEYEYYNEQIVFDTAKIAFCLAEKRKKKIMSLDKANVLESSMLWRKTVEVVGCQHPEIELTHCYIDTAAMKILEKPLDFDVFVTSNLFGDIISDEGTQLTGTPCLYASAEISKSGKGIYTPNQLHNPDESLIGKQEVNPIGMIEAVALMLRFSFELEQEARLIEMAINQVINQNYGTKDIWNSGKILLSTREMGEEIVRVLEEITQEARL